MNSPTGEWYPVLLMSPKNKKRGSIARKRNGQVAQKTITGVRIPDCTRAYAAVLADPFSLSEDLPSPCVPDSICLPSWKFSARTKGTFETNSQGNAWISVNVTRPYGNATSEANYPVLTSSGTSVWDPTLAYSTATNQVGHNLVSPIDVLSLGAQGLEVRCVGFGIKAYYSGSNFTRQGSALIVSHPSNDDLSSHSYTRMLQLPGSKLAPVGSSTVFKAIYKPKRQSDLVFNTGDGGRQMMIYFDGISNAGDTPVTFEVVAYYEAIGYYIGAGKHTAAGYSVSHSDPVGFGAAMEVAGTPAGGTHSPAEFLRHMANAIKNTASHIAPIVSGVNDVYAAGAGAVRLLGV